MAVPQSKPFRSARMPDAFERDPLPETSSGASGNCSGSYPGNLDQSTALVFLKELIAAGDHSLDPVLGTITDVARQLTAASGAALAMWKDGAMVCRARSGDIAPVLGAQLSAETGISGECLRTSKIQHCADTENDPLVDLEVCRSLGLGSIAVLPICDWRGINGILEVFSTQQAAFTEQHIAFLQQLAVLAERARTSKLESASSAAPQFQSEIEKPPSALRLVSYRVRKAVLAYQGIRLRPFVLSTIGFVAVALLALAIWLGWRAGLANGKAHVVQSSAPPARVNTATSDPAIAHPPDNDEVWKVNPGGESVYPSNKKPSAGAPVTLASDVKVGTGMQTHADRAQNRSLSSGDLAPNVVIRRQPLGPGSKAGAQTESQTNLHSDATPSSEPPSIPGNVASQSSLNEVLSAKVSLPGLGAPVSRGVSGGQLVHRVPPIYPAQARLVRLEGTVILAALITEDGRVRDVKVIEGPPLLAQSAVDAVKLWRYKPYELDGKPVKNEIRITVDFKLPNH